MHSLFLFTSVRTPLSLAILISVIGEGGVGVMRYLTCAHLLGLAVLLFGLGLLGVRSLYLFPLLARQLDSQDRNREVLADLQRVYLENEAHEHQQQEVGREHRQVVEENVLVRRQDADAGGAARLRVVSVVADAQVIGAQLPVQRVLAALAGALVALIAEGVAVFVGRIQIRMMQKMAEITGRADARIPGGEPRGVRYFLSEK